MCIRDSIITKQADANVIETVDRILALVPEIKTLVPAGVDIDAVSYTHLDVYKRQVLACRSQPSATP